MVSDLTTFAHKGCKIATQKKFVFGRILPYWAQFFLVSVFLTLFNGLFAPTSLNPMSKLFRFLESLGKSNGKKWSQIWQYLIIKGVKSSRQKKFFLRIFFHLFTPFKRLFSPTSRSPMSKLFRYTESLAKSNGKKWFQIYTFLLKNCVKLPRRKKFFTDFFSSHLFTPFNGPFAQFSR